MERNEPDRLLLIAARKPVAGQTKTRLGAAIGMERAATLYQSFLHDLARRFMGEPQDFAVGWAYTPESHPFRDTIEVICPSLDPDSVRYVQQVGADWAERQARLLRWGSEHGFASTILTASDSPQMTREVVETAFEALESADVVIGRVHDGGYYLIGVRGDHDVVTGVPMSTASAADSLIAQAEQRGLRVAMVEPTFDVDIEPDLDLLVALCRADPQAAPATAATLEALGLIDRPHPATTTPLTD
jgi:rSAM/selenodomain-associated transferase 1